jgi:hypothetical protein
VRLNTGGQSVQIRTKLYKPGRMLLNNNQPDPTKVPKNTRKMGEIREPETKLFVIRIEYQALLSGRSQFVFAPRRFLSVMVNLEGRTTLGLALAEMRGVRRPTVR